jgi:hypothetical protein
MLYKLTNRVRELEKQLRLKKMPTTSKNSSQSPSLDFKGEKKKQPSGLASFAFLASIRFCCVSSYL